MTAAAMPRTVDAAPFDLRCERADGREPAAALCLHGLTGTPYEVRPLAEALVSRGIRARGPLLPGHNSTPEALSLLPRDAWVDAVHDEYSRLRAQHERVFLVGLSLGGLLSLELAAREPVEGLVVIGVPLQLRQPIPLLIPVIKHLRKMLSKREGSDIQDPEARSRHPGYDQMPLASIHQLIRIQRVVRGGLARVAAPTLVAHGALDSTADPRDAHRIHREVGSEVKELIICERSGHVVPVDWDGEALARSSADFLEHWV